MTVSGLNLILDLTRTRWEAVDPPLGPVPTHPSDLDPDLEWPVKNQSVAKRNREDGNDAFTAGNFDLSLLLYSEAMRYSPVNENTLEGEDMAAAAANRFDFNLCCFLCL